MTHHMPPPFKPLGGHRGIWAEGLLVAGIMALAAVFRFAAIGDKSLWFDEAYSFTVASRLPRDVIAMAAGQDTHPPLYYLLLSLWIRAFGAGEVALRSLGAAASTLTVGGTWWLGRRLGGPAVGYLAAFLTAVAPLQVQSAQEARMYPLLGFLTLVSWATLLVALDGRRWAWLAYVAATGLALYTHYFGFLSVAGQGLYVFFLEARLRRQWLTSQLAVLLLYLPWLGTFFDTLFSGKGWPFFRPPVGVDTLTGLLGMFSFGGYAFGFDGYFGGAMAPVGAQLAILVPFLALAAAGLVALSMRPHGPRVVLGYLAVPVLLAFLFSLRQNVFYPRYFSYVFPAYAVILACGMKEAGARLVPASPRVAVLVLLLGFLAFNAPVLNDVYTNPKLASFNWRGAAALLSEQAGPKDLIVVIPAFARIPFAYYFKKAQPVVPMTPREFFDMRKGYAPRDPAAETVTRRSIRSYASRYEVLWVVATLPFPATAMERFRNSLTGIYEVRGVADYNGIVVTRMVRHAGWKGTQ